MLRRLPVFTAMAALLVVSPGLSTRSGAADDPRFAADFVQGLRERGYYDLAIEYLANLSKSPDAPSELKRTIEYEEGRTLIEAASHSSDPEASKEKLDQARVKIEGFVKKYPDLPETTGALVELAHLLYERGRTEVDIAGEDRMAAEKDTRMAAARGYYASARDTYTRAFDRLGAQLKGYAVSLPADSPKYVEREKVRASMMSADLQRTVVDYYEAQTYPVKSKERTELLEKGVGAFDAIRKKYRTMLAGFTAQMWQAKCYEEQGKYGEAMGIYNELVGQQDPALRPLQKKVDFFRIIVMDKREEYAAAADECVRWLNAFPKDRRSYEAIGVQYELGKCILAQVEKAEPTGPERDKAVRVATEHLGEVVRVYTPFKEDAVKLLRKYRPSMSLKVADVVKLNYDDAMAQADGALAVQDYDKAIALLKVAVRKGDPIRDPAKANKARYMLAYSCYMTRRYYEAAVLAEFLATRYPSGEFSAKATEIGITAYIDAYNTYTVGDRTGDLDRLISLARYTAKTWPDTEQADSARMAIGQVSNGRGDYPAAIAAFDAVRVASSKWIEAQSACGGSHWKQSLVLRDQKKEKEADAEVKLAVEKFQSSLKARRDANAPETDPGYVNTACDLAGVELETGKVPDALALLDPVAKKLMAARSASTTANASRVLSLILRAHVSTGNVDQAVKDMQSIEALGGAGSSSAELYFGLGRLLEREIEGLRQRNDKAALKRTEQAYEKFLKALVASKTGQSFQSLRWAGENLLKIGSAKEASEVFANIITYYAKDPEFLKTPGTAENLTIVRIKQASALRQSGKLSEAEALLNEVIEANKRMLEPQMEKGFLLEAKAEAKQGTWTEAYAFWKSLAGKLGGQTPKQDPYFEAWYQAAVALQKQGKKDLARQTLASVMSLSRNVGSPEMKERYQAFVKQLSK